MLRKLCLGGMLLAMAATSWGATNRPEGYVTICKINETCSVSSSTNVAFGASGQFVFKVLNGSFSCTVATFGSDPIPEKAVKECSVPSSGTTPPPTGSTISLSASAGNGSVSLSWSYSSGSGATQEVYRDLDADPNGRVRIASVSASTRSYTDSGLTNGTTYYYSIKNTASGVATNSNIVSATPSGGGTSPPPTGSNDRAAFANCD